MTQPPIYPYFIGRLDEHSYRPMPEATFEVQILGSDGQTQRCAYIGRDSNDVIALIDVLDGRLPVVGHGIPAAVIEAARSCARGSGEYVDESGTIIQPSFLAGISKRAGTA